MKIDLSREQLTVVVLAVALVASAMLVSPAMVFSQSGSSDAKTGETYYTNTTVETHHGVGAARSFDEADMLSVPDSYTRSSTEAATEPPDVAASAGAQTMSVTATKQNGEIAIRLTDDRVHEGRWVSIPASWFLSELGSVPEVAYVTHESGSEYQTDLHSRGGSVAFFVEEFSTNVVTFSGEVNVTGDFTDGASAQWQLADFDSASDPVVNLTGVVNTEWDNESAAGVSAGGTSSVSIGGNTAPAGPSEEGRPVLSVTAGGAGSANIVESQGDGNTDTARYLVGDSDNEAQRVEIQFTAQYTGRISTLTLDIGAVSGSDYGATADMYLVSEAVDTTYREGTKIVDSWDPAWSTGTKEVSLDNPVSIEEGTTYTLEVVTDSTDSDGTDDVIQLDADYSGTDKWTANGLSRDGWGDITYSYDNSVSGLSVSTNDGASASFGDYGSTKQTKTRVLNVTEATDTLDFSASSGYLDYTLETKERTLSENISAELNTETVSHSGTLADGETTSLTVNKSVLQEGTNYLNVSVGDGSLSADAPEPTVHVDVSHDAVDKQAVEHGGGQWTETYNVSETFSSERSDATLTIPYQADIYSIQNLEARVNETSWSSVANASYSLENTTLTVDLNDVYGGTIDDGATVEVRTTGIAVKAANASITVVDPTTPGQPLNSTVQVDSWDADATLDVSGTPRGDRLHYTSGESWDVEESALFTSEGSQTLSLPGASAGDQFRVSTLPLRLEPHSGDVVARVPDARVNRSQPVYRVTPGESVSDAYDVTFTNATDGEEYILWSETNEVVVDSGTASSPLTLTDDSDNVALMQFRLDSGLGGGSGSDGSSGGGVPAPLPTTGGDTNFVPLIALAIVGGLVLVAARNDGAVADAGESAADSIESGLDGVPVVGPVLGKTLAGGVEGVTQLAEGIAGNQTVALGIVAALGIGAVQGGIVEVPQSSLTLIVVAGIGLFSLVALREFGEFTTERWAAILGATTVVSLQTLSNQSLLAAIVNSRVWPILALAAVYLAYKLIQGIRSPGQEPPTNIVIEGNTEEGDQQ